MNDLTATYTFEGDEIFAIHEGRVIASGKDMEKVEGDAVKYLDSLKKARDKKASEQAEKKATHIITPNGVKGEILGRTPTVWGTQVTARFENGEIKTFDTHAESNVKWLSENVKTAGANPLEKLTTRLDEDYSHDRRSLVQRHDELSAIAREASELLSRGASYDIEVRLDQIKTAADYERSQIKEAIDHLDSADAENFIPDAPFNPTVVEQADVGPSSGSWLDVTTQQMIDESEGQDFEKLLHEGPGLFVTELDDGALADSGVTREMALSHITSKTAGFQGEEIDDYREQFIARTEIARRDELAARKVNIHKEAAAEQEIQSNTPDDVLFM
jgi:hypothetical protein